MRRAAVSISANIAEGSGRNSDRDFARFVEIAYGSLMEVVSHGYVAQNQSFLSNDSMTGLVQQAEELGRMLSGLKSRLEGP
jgi:four helix bundle protein